jgi:hypothetical protein
MTAAGWRDGKRSSTNGHWQTACGYRRRQVRSSDQEALLRAPPNSEVHESPWNFLSDSVFSVNSLERIVGNLRVLR